MVNIVLWTVRNVVSESPEKNVNNIFLKTVLPIGPKNLEQKKYILPQCQLEV